MTISEDNNTIKLFSGNSIKSKMKQHLLQLTLWEIRTKACQISYALDSIRELGVRFEQYDEKNGLECCDCAPIMMSEKDFDEFYINISIISDHYNFVAASLETLRLLEIQQDCFEKQRRKKYEKFGFPTEPEKFDNPSGEGDPSQGSLF